jgi:hypothetical protein
VYDVFEPSMGTRIFLNKIAHKYNVASGLYIFFVLVILRKFKLVQLYLIQ